MTRMEVEVIPDMVKEYDQKVVDDIDMDTFLARQRWLGWRTVFGV